MMNDEKWTIKLGEKSKMLEALQKGEYFDDLDKIASTLKTSKENLLKGEIIKDIRVEKINIWQGMKAIQFIYKITTNDGTYSIKGDGQGSEKGSLTTLDFEPDEHLTLIKGSHMLGTEQVTDLIFVTYTPSKKKTRLYGPYGREGRYEYNWKLSNGNVHVCFFGKKSGGKDWITGFGMYEGKIISSHNQQQITNLQKERDNLKKEHSNCPTTIQTLTNQKSELEKTQQTLTTERDNWKTKYEELQNQMNALLGVPQMEAKVQQVDLPPK
jgi:hypothetical protein